MRQTIIFHDIRSSLDLNIPEYSFLDNLYFLTRKTEWYGINPEGLGKDYGLTKAAVKKMIDKLTTMGLIQSNDFGLIRPTEKWNEIYSEDVKIFYRKVFDESTTWDVVWRVWLKYKQDQHKQKYKSPESENIAREKLWELAEGDLNKAIAIVKRSMAQLYMGLLPYEEDKRRFGQHQEAKQIVGPDAVDKFNKAAEERHKKLKNG